jgi:hypothetical protein
MFHKAVDLPKVFTGIFLLYPTKRSALVAPVPYNLISHPLQPMVEPAYTICQLVWCFEVDIRLTDDTHSIGSCIEKYRRIGRGQDEELWKPLCTMR